MYSFISRLYKEFILWTPFFQSIKENAPTIITFSREPKSNHCYFQGRMNEWIIPSCRCKGLPSFKYKEHRAQNHKGWGVFSAPGTQDQGYSEVALKIISTANMSAHLSLVCDVSSKKKKNRKMASQAVISPQIVFPLSSHIHQQPWRLWTSDYSISDGTCHDAAKALSHYSTQ